MLKENLYLLEYFGSIIESGDLAPNGHCYHVRQCSDLLLDKLLMFFRSMVLPKEIRQIFPLLPLCMIWEKWPCRTGFYKSRSSWILKSLKL